MCVAMVSNVTCREQYVDFSSFIVLFVFRISVVAWMLRCQPRISVWEFDDSHLNISQVVWSAWKRILKIEFIRLTTDCCIHLKCSMPSNNIFPDRISSGKFVMVVFDICSVRRLAIPFRRYARRSAANMRSIQHSMASWKYKLFHMKMMKSINLGSR